MAKLAQTVVKFLVPYSCYNKGEDAGFSPKAAERLIKGNVAVKVKDTDLVFPDGPGGGVSTGLASAKPDKDADADKAPKGRRRGA